MKRICSLALILSILMVATASRVGADEPPKDAKDLHKKLERERKRDEILAEHRERVRRELLKAFRAQSSFAAAYVLDDGASEPQGRVSRFLYFSDGVNSCLSWLRSGGSEKREGVLWVLTPERFVIAVVGKSKTNVVGRGLEFARARVSRINRELQRLSANGAGIQTCTSWHPQIAIGLEPSADGRSNCNVSLGMETLDGTTPSWLKRSSWKDRELGGKAAKHIELRADGVQRRIGVQDGLLIRDTLRGQDGQLIGRLQRFGEDKLAAVSRQLIQRLGALPLNADGEKFDTGTRQIDFDRLIARITASMPVGQSPPDWLTKAAPALIRAVFDDQLARDEIKHLVAWGRARLDAIEQDAAATDVAKLKATLLPQMCRELSERWWGPMEKSLPASKPKEQGKQRLPVRSSPLASLLANAVRMYARECVLAAWSD